MADIPELAKVLIVSAPVGLFKKMELATVGGVLMYRPIASAHFHVTDLPFTGIRELYCGKPCVLVPILFASWGGEQEHIRMLAARSDPGLPVSAKPGVKVRSTVVSLAALEHGYTLQYLTKFPLQVDAT
ncbi:MAG: hypothetical protein FJ271_33160 [Planctomycetes bacterium]|nr:hypothetical protein [Planctomycetota bacterium]